jgi:hypothetical protein
MQILLAVLLWAAWFGTTEPGSAEPGVEGQIRAGQGDAVVVLSTSGELHRFAGVTLESPGGLRARTGSGETRDLSLNRVAGILFPGSSSIEREDGVEMRFANGDRLLGSISSGDEFQVRFRTTAGQVAVDIERITEIRFPSLRALQEQPPGLRAHPENDRLFRVTGKGVDLIEGTLVSFGEEGVVFSGPLGEFPFRYEELAAIVLARQESPPLPPPPSAQVRLRDGSRLTGRLVALEEEGIRVESPALGRSDLPTDEIAAITLRDASFVYLSDLEPREVLEMPYFGSPSEFLFPFQRDRSVTGGPLLLGGIRYEKGLGLHSHTTLTYELGGRYRTFHAVIGVDDEVARLPATGCMAFRVVVDGEVRHESGLVRQADGPTVLPGISVAGATSMSIVVDFGDRSDSGDRAIWANALLTTAD